jgi:taurine dioxygenase
MKYDLASYRHLAIAPLGGVIGAEVGGVDLSGDINPSVFAEIQQALNEHYVLCFRDQKLDALGLARFAERFAPLSIVPYTQPVAEHPKVTHFRRDANIACTVRNIGDRWHSDQASRDRPNMGAVLYCVEAPPYGGDTLFASLCAAYEGLSPALQDICRSLIGIHSASGVFGADGRGGGNKKPLVLSGSGRLRRADLPLVPQVYARAGQLPAVSRSWRIPTPPPERRVPFRAPAGYPRLHRYPGGQRRH